MTLKWLRGTAARLAPGGGKGVHQHTVFATRSDMDPANEVVLSSIVRYAEEVWTATDPTLMKHRSRHIKTGELLAGVRAVQERNKHKIVQRGPISSMMKYLKELGWKLETPTTMRNQRGQPVLLAEGDPKRLKLMLQEALREQHENKVEERMIISGGCNEAELADLVENGIDFEAIRRVQRAKRVSNRAKHIVTQLAAGSYPIGARLRTIGVEVPNICPCCLEGPDTISHRCWSCPALTEQRARCIPAKVLKWAKAGGEHTLLARRCLGCETTKFNDLQKRP